VGAAPRGLSVPAFGADVRGVGGGVRAGIRGDNILAAQRAPWLVIDPKPYIGDPAYDVLQHILNCEDRLAADPAALATRMAELAGVDAGRVRLWLFARSVQESIGSPLMHQVACRLAPA